MIEVDKINKVKGKYDTYKNVPKNTVSKLKVKTKAVTGSISSDSEVMHTLQNLLNENHLPYYFLIYKFNEVLICKTDSKIFDEKLVNNLDPKLLKEVRIFSKDSELYVWRSRESFSYRFREDEVGDESSWTYEEYHMCWGTQLEGSKQLLEEFRGIKLLLPFGIEDESYLPLRYLVRNYFTFDKDNFITFCDARLVKFVTERGDI